MKKNNRITKSEFRDAMRRTTRRQGQHLLIMTKQSEGVTKVGFVTPASQVGNAVARNTVRRRLRMIADEVITQHPNGLTIVVRAGKGAAEVDFNALRAEFMKGLAKSIR